MNDFWTKTEALLTALVALGIVKVGDSRQIASILIDVQAITASGGQSADQLANEVEQLLVDLGVSGTTMHVADQFTAFERNIKGNQVGIIRGNTSLFGVRGAYGFIPAASDQGVSLGLAGPA